MPRKPKAKTEPKAKSPEPKQAAPRGAKTAAIRQALKANPQKTAKEITELLKEQGFETTANYVGTLKTALRNKKKKAKAAPAPAPAAPAVPKDTISLAWLQKAKALATQLGGVKQAKQALDALAHLMD